jgi:hypothetical protein
MTLALGIADDYRAWDGTESVILHSARRTPSPRAERVSVAKRRAVRGREKSPSGGAYAGYELRWHLPVRLLSPGFRPKPGDAIQDGDAVLWTVLTADLGVEGWLWSLGCVNLVLAHDLSDVVAIERPDITYDPAGVPVKAFPTGTPQLGGRVLYQGIAARVQRMDSHIADERGGRALVGRYEVIVGVPVSVTIEDRIRWVRPPSGRIEYLNILGTHNPERIDELQVIEAELKP